MRLDKEYLSTFLLVLRNWLVIQDGQRVIQRCPIQIPPARQKGKTDSATSRPQPLRT